MKYTGLAIAALGILVSTSAFATEGQTYLPPQEAVAVLADGDAWSAASPNGRNFQLTLNEDGTGSISGALPVPLSVSWEVKGDDMCIVNAMISKCLRFSEIPGGLQSWNEGQPDLKLTR